MRCEGLIKRGVRGFEGICEDLFYALMVVVLCDGMHVTCRNSRMVHYERVNLMM